MKVIVTKTPLKDTEDLLCVAQGNALAVGKEAHISKIVVKDGRVIVYVEVNGGTDIMEMPFTPTEQVVVDV